MKVYTILEIDSELSENTGVPIINEYHKVKLFGGNYKKAFMELVDIILTDNEE